MKCAICNKDFTSKRSSAKYCSSKCRKLAFLSVPKVSVLENGKVSVPPVSVPVTDKPTVPDMGILKCKVESCKLMSAPGHNYMCIYHWRKVEGLATIPEEEYLKLNA